jgi:hypothetical protein
VTDARTAISNLIYTYAERIDAGDFDGVADLFTDAVVTAEGGVVSRGRDEVLAMYTGSTRRYEDTGTPKTKHVTTNLILDSPSSPSSPAATATRSSGRAGPGGSPPGTWSSTWSAT